MDHFTESRAGARVAPDGYDGFLALARQGTVIPVVKRVLADLSTTYTLEAGASSLLIETRVTMNEDEETLVQCFDVLLFGSGLEPFGVGWVAPNLPGELGGGDFGVV